MARRRPLGLGAPQIALKGRRNIMKMRKLGLALLLVFAVAAFASTSMVHAGSIQGAGPWKVYPGYIKGGDVYTGEVAITASIVPTTNYAPSQIPLNYISTPEFYNEVLATLTFVMRLNPKRGLPMTFSGVGQRKFDPDSSQADPRMTMFFHLPADYFAGSFFSVLGDALYGFVAEATASALPGSVLTNVVEISENVANQLTHQVDPATGEPRAGSQLLTWDPDTGAAPLHMWLEVEVVQP
jgi:hypothetical protein